MNHANLPVIDDATPLSAFDVTGGGRGRIKRDYARQPLGYCARAPHSGDEILIPESEWRDRSAQQWKDESTLWHLLLDRVPVLDQGSTNYCWINAPTYCTMAQRCVMGLPYVKLSPASVGGPIKGYRNVGGWGTEGLEYIAEHGLVPDAMWPANAISRSYDTEETRAIRSQFRVTEWDDITPNSWRHLISYVLQNKPVAVGYDWWSHEVSAIAAVWESGDWSLIIANSWGTGYGDRGFGKLRGSRKLPDDACSPRVVTA